MAFHLTRQAPRLLRAPSALPRTFSTTTRALAGLSDVKYTAKAKGVGGRNGKAEILDEEHGLNVTLAMPKALGGSGKGVNPEQLFSLGYSSCFLGAMGLSARGLKIKLPDSVSVETRTSIGTPKGGSGFGIGLKVIVRGEGSGIDKGDLEKVVEEAHKVCDFSARSLWELNGLIIGLWGF